MQPNQEVQKPFFAQFLESQTTKKGQQFWPILTGKLVDSPGNETQKYPSDGDEEGEII